ncbi:endonuclease NucS domain-containing protein [Aquisalinus flavus]|uniref:Endonuclease NucS C-terminal domain-containing protein n=1 Tax=Aquisalinus flavus TaxID=1526572 RepID=A0A8J2V7I0_9PROT|nr:endonuclease NucS domain-containing protein [Aquisalinus flavus]MBD0426432.1 DUF91 domain-containing protein [Aquisalinus flavus]UNE48014.1 DUF91 domain-containing protein [Aquisalinus flavus]GGD07958.1 hypothetical protein GCM10011342_16040 [Aquisalinus flavus]
MVQRHIVALPIDGALKIFPLKRWARENPDQFSGNFNPDHTSHQLRGVLIKNGWLTAETEDQFMLFPREAAHLVNEIDHSDEQESEVDVEVGSEENDISFAMEHQLRDFIIANLNGIDVGGKKLSLFRDSDGRDGKEYRTGVGLIDILAIDEDGNFVVFELKRAKSPDHAIGQIARYMGWLTANIGKDKEVSGVIVAKTIDEKLQYAIRVMPNVSLFEYSVSFTLNQVDAF